MFHTIIFQDYSTPHFYKFNLYFKRHGFWYYIYLPLLWYKINKSASCNYTRLFINSGLTIGEDIHGNLVVIGSGDSYILGFVDSKQMVKIFAHHKNTYLGLIFLNFYRKSKQTFRKKSYSKMVRRKRLEVYLSRI